MNHLKAEVLSHFNEPVLCGFELGRIIGYGEDEMDCYMIVQFRGGKIIWNTMVGGYYYLDKLKEQGKVISTEGELWNDFTRLDNILELNGAPKAKTPLIMERDDEDYQ